MRKKVEICLVGLILIVATLLRINRYAEFPIVGETADEFAWTMLGASLIENGKPAAWSLFTVYEDPQYTREETLDIGTGRQYPIVEPVFDHPPLFAFLPGLAQSIRSEWSAAPSAKVMRLPLIALGVFNVFLLYLVARSLYNDTAFRIVPTIIYATAPLFVFSSRLVIAENLLITWLLLSLLVLFTLKEGKKKFWLLTIFAALAILTKMSGIIIPGLLIASGIAQKNNTWKAGILGLLIGLGVFAGYGAFYDWQLFIEVFTTQANRGLGFLTFHARSLIHPAIVDKFFTDGWFITGLIGIAALFVRSDEKATILKLAFITNLLFVLFFVDEQMYHGWYDFPFYPLLALAVGYLVQLIWKEKNYLLFGLLWVLLLPVSRYGMIGADVYYQLGEISPWIMRIIMAAGMLPWLVSQLFKNRAANSIIMAILCCYIIIINIVTVVTFTQDTYWSTDERLLYRGYIFPD